MFAHPFGHVDAVRYAVAVGDDDRRPVESFRFRESLDRLLIIGAHGYARHVDVAVGHGDHTQVFLGQRFAAGRELRDRAQRGGLGHLAAGVGVNFGVQHQDLDVAPGSQDVIQAAVPYIIGPAVPAEYPQRFAHEIVGQRQQTG